DYLGEESLNHFEGVQAILKDAGIPYKINPRLVRGLDYYNLTVFEWVTDQLGAQGTVCAGGRYDGLVGQLGGKPAPACGFAMGVERLLALWQDQGYEHSKPVPDVYVVHQGEAAARHAFRTAELLRDAGFAVHLHCGGGSFKSQMKKADASGAALAAVIGDDEAAANEISLKPLRLDEAARGNPENAQRRVALDQAAEAAAEWILGSEE
ncbi:MAG: histidine--tRNA ligase, partial [Rhodocyclaceae bacterium]